MNSVIEDIQKKLVFPIDYPKQRKYNQYNKIILIIAGIISSLIGFTTQSLFLTFIIYLAFIILTLLVLLPGSLI